MKRYLYLPLVILLIANIEKAYGQEEFYGDHNGLSLSYLQGLSVGENKGANGVGLSAYFKKGFILELGLQKTNNTTYPLASAVFCPNWGIDSSYFKMGFGVSYAYLQDQQIVGFTTGVVRCFLKETKMPFSIHISVSPQIDFMKKEAEPSYYYKTTQVYSSSFAAVVGCGYTQAFFAKKCVYPFIEFSYERDLTTRNDLFSAEVGLNIKL